MSGVHGEFGSSGSDSSIQSVQSPILGPEGLIHAPNGFTFSPQPIEQRWTKGNCKAKGGNPFDCGENRLVQVEDYNIIFCTA
ncbi:hypothetical protein KOW79_000746 [Hemibagrus wyckioides]|uniref:Uncharacterized protein n=1 Tax=Hemibagrus wyckioides TaxID=337641 RepID=A0A9D3P7D6_9TELE|nr:hypothetical protein KOW79_000746 [Hemibagrus wyckioides]